MFSWFKKLGIIILVFFIFAGNANTAIAESCADEPCGSGSSDKPSQGGGGSGGGGGGSQENSGAGTVGGGNSGGSGIVGGGNTNGSSGGGSGSNGAVGGGGSGGSSGGSESDNNGGDNNNGGNSGGNSGNGGGSSGSTPAVPATKIAGCVPGSGDLFDVTSGKSCTVSATPAVPGQVLGAASFNFTKFMKNGSNGNEIIELQKFLTTLGYTLVADGKFGPKTKGAVIKFQIANKLKGDGIVGALTRAVLNK